MTDIATNLSTIDGSLSDIKTAIVAKGVTPSGNITTYATAIGQISGGGGSGKYQLLERVKDDSNNEIGTVSGFFTDANDVEYAVVCLDAINRNYGSWCSDKNTVVTNMPIYNGNNTNWWYDNAKETATQNTQLILDFCNANGYTSTACDMCRNISFVIDGVTYYGQFPNMRQLFDIWVHRAEINNMDTSGGSKLLGEYSTFWASTQYNKNDGFYISGAGITNFSKIQSYLVCPVIEIPNS